MAATPGCGTRPRVPRANTRAAARSENRTVEGRGMSLRGETSGPMTLSFRCTRIYVPDADWRRRADEKTN